MNGDRQRLRGRYDEDFYWERVDRNLGWLGDTTEEQRERQARLRDAVIGIGGAAAARLVRMGALNLKLADPDHFDLTNVQRQYGAGRDTIGRNKAEVVAQQLLALTGGETAREIRDMHFAASLSLIHISEPTRPY